LRASAGHTLNQSIVVQLTSDGNLRADMQTERQFSGTPRRPSTAEIDCNNLASCLLQCLHFGCTSEGNRHADLLDLLPQALPEAATNRAHRKHQV
jgi:hypothetical protein